MATEAAESKPVPLATTTVSMLPEAQLDPALEPTGETRDPALPDARNVFVTGGTGFLGAFMVHGLLRDTSATVHCLVRADDADAARRRVLDNLTRFGLPQPDDPSRIEPLVGDVTQPRLGIGDADHERLQGELDGIYHGAASLNWKKPYDDIKRTNVAGIRSVLELAAGSERSLPVHHISTVAVLPFWGLPEAGEDFSLEHDGWLLGGYTQSKWVAERTVHAAAERGFPVRVYRPGGVTGSSRTGHFAQGAYLEAFLKGCIQHRSAPDSDMPFDMVPVDYVADALLHISRTPNEERTFHLTNPTNDGVQEIFDAIEAYGYPLERQPFEEWKKGLLSSPDFAQNALKPFDWFLGNVGEQQITPPRYLSTRTQAAVEGSDLRCPPVAELIPTYLDHWVEIGFLEPPPG
jgi:thioester reductase-like protein